MKHFSFLVPPSSFLEQGAALGSGAALETLAQPSGLAPKYSRLRLYFGA